MLEECVKGSYYAKFHTHSYQCCRELHFNSRLDVNFIDDVNLTKSVEHEM